MRITGGIYRSRVLVTPDGNTTRPTSDRTKEAMFNIIAPFVANASILDIFSGSGALGLEAISRGAAKVTFIDNNKEAIKAIKTNIENLKISNYRIIEDSYEIISSLDDKYDIILLDPPYALDVIDNIIKIVEEKKLLNDNGIIVYESDVNHQIKEYEGYRIKNKKYGIAYLSIFYKE